MSGSANAWKSTRTHREAMVTRSRGTSSARITNTVDAGGSSMVLSSTGRSLRAQQVELVRGSAPCASLRPARAPTGGRSPPAWSLEMAGPTRCDLPHVRVLAGSGQAGVSAGSVTGRIEEQRREGPCGLQLRAAGRTDEQIGVHGIGGCRRQQGHGGRLADDLTPDVLAHAADDGTTHPRPATPAAVGSQTPRRSRTAVRMAAATSSSDRLPSTTTQRSGSSAASARKPSATRW